MTLPLLFTLIALEAAGIALWLTRPRWALVLGQTLLLLLGG